MGKTFFLTLKATEQSRVVVSISHLGDYKQISDATPLQVSLKREGSVFYYLVDPYQEEAKIIIEAIPDDEDTEFELYVKTVDVSLLEDNTEDHSHVSTLPIWMIPPEEIKSNPEFYVKYYSKEQTYEDILREITNDQSNGTQKVMLIYIET